MSILIGADFVPTKSNEYFFANNEMDKVIGIDLGDIIRNAEYSIFNLELPITNKVSPIEKTGPVLRTNKTSINGYRDLDIKLLTLANNHILDQGTDGLKDTIEILKQNNIDYVGAGNNLSEASQPFVFTANNKKIGVYACTEHEFSIATHTSYGANPFDPLESYDHVSELKKKCDYLIVLYHGGKEHYRYPSPMLQKICRKFVDKGADIVICQHSHCIGCEEKYKESTIVYGQGNFLFDNAVNECWHTSLLIEIDENGINYLPLVKYGNGVRLADKYQSGEILEAFYKRSEEIKCDGFVEKQYVVFAKSMRKFYLEVLNGVNRQGVCYRTINKITGGKYSTRRINKIYSKEKLAAIRNFTECEAHIELLLKSIE